MNITWHNPVTNPPEITEELILAVHGEEDTSIGVHVPKNGGYRLSDGHWLDDAQVYAYAYLPKPPDPAELCEGWVSTIASEDTNPGDDAIMT